MPTVRTLEIDQSHNATQLCLKLDQLEQQRREAQIRIISYQQQIKASYRKVKPRKFQVGDLSLKWVIQSTKERNVGKFGPN